MTIDANIPFEQQPQDVQEHIFNYMAEYPRNEELSEKEFCGMRGDEEIHRYTKEVWVDGDYQYSRIKTYNHPAKSRGAFSFRESKISISHGS